MQIRFWAQLVQQLPVGHLDFVGDLLRLKIKRASGFRIWLVKTQQKCRILAVNELLAQQVRQFPRDHLDCIAPPANEDGVGLERLARERCK